MTSLIEQDLEKCKYVKDNSDNPDEIREAATALTTASHKIAEQMYKTASPDQDDAGCGSGSCKSGAHHAEDADTVEAEFEEETVGKGA